MADPVLHVHDWDEHQSYRRDRGQPPWIKVHRANQRLEVTLEPVP